ncbi:MAG: hypothetical protein ACI8ZM_004548, partial [Crocinitomix sp.]
MKHTKLIVLLLFLLVGALSKHVRAQEVPVLMDKIVADPRDAEVYFSGFTYEHPVSIFGDYAVVGASRVAYPTDDEGVVYLYWWNEDECEWELVDKIVARSAPTGPPDGDPNDRFGVSVSLHGTTIAIGASGVDIMTSSNAGMVYIYEINIVSHIAVFKEQLIAFDNLGDQDTRTGDAFGLQVDLTGDRLIVGSPRNDLPDDSDLAGYAISAGAAYIYHRTLGSFNFINKIVAPVADRHAQDYFGSGVSIHGDFAVVGAREDDANLITGIESGVAFVYRWNGTDWVDPPQRMTDVDLATGDNYGWNVTINQQYLGIASRNNDKDAAGSPSFGNAGAVYMYRLDGLTWIADGKIVAADRVGGERFGSDIELSDNRIVIGAVHHDKDVTGGGGPDLSSSGKAYVFSRDISWTEDHQLVASEREAGDEFGNAVAINGKRILIGAHEEEDDGDDLGTNEANAGSAFIFELLTMPDIPTIESDEALLCSDGMITTLTITAGDLNDADYWEWYADDCDSSPIGTGETIDVSLSDGTTFCARGVWDCELGDPGDCACITIEEDENFWHIAT